MPFQSEKQRRFLHANHPEIAKRWESEYATGGISNHFRKRFFKGAEADTSGSAGGKAMSPGTSTTGGTRHGGGGRNGATGGGGHHPPVYTGPTAEEIAAAKAKAEAEKKAAEIKAYKEWITKTKKDKKKKVSWKDKLETFGDKLTDITDSTLALGTPFATYFTGGKWAPRTPGMDKNLEDIVRSKMKVHSPNYPSDFTKASLSGTIGYSDYDESQALGTSMPNLETVVQDVLSGKISTQEFANMTTLGRLNYNVNPTTKEITLGSNEYNFRPDVAEDTGYFAKLANKTNRAIEPDLTLQSGGVARKNYFHGGIAALNAQLNQLPEYYLPAAQGGRIGFHRGSLRHQKEHDYKSLEDKGNFMRYLMLSGDRARMSSPENVINRLVNPKMGYTQKRDDFETWQKERFMYGEKKDPLINLGKSELDKKINTWLKELFAKKNGEDFIDDEELNLVKGGIANHFKKRVKLQDSVESLSDTEFQTMYPDWDPNQFTREEYLQLISENEGNGILDLSTNEEAIEVASTEENEIIPDLIAPGSAAGILQLKDGGTPRRRYFTGAYGGGGADQDDKGGSSSSGGHPHGGVASQYSGSTKTSSPSTGSGRTRIQEEKQEEFQKQQFKDVTKGTLSDPDEKYDTPEQHLADTPGDLDKNSPRYNPYKSRLNVKYKNDNYEQTLANQKAKLKKLGLQKLIPLFAMIAFGVPPMDALKTFPKTISITQDDLTSLIAHGLPVMKAKKELIEALENHQGGLLKDVDITNPNEMVNLEETTNFIETRDKLTDLTQRPDEDDGGPDGQPLTIDVVAETKEEIEGAPNMISMMDIIRARQAKHAMLVDKGIIQDNPIVDESVTDITMTANKGGLANLFRVKKQ